MRRVLIFFGIVFAWTVIKQLDPPDELSVVFIAVAAAALGWAFRLAVGFALASATLLLLVLDALIEPSASVANSIVLVTIAAATLPAAAWDMREFARGYSPR